MSVSSRHSPRAKIPVSVQTPQSTPAVLIWAIAATRCHGIRLPGHGLYLRNLRQSTIKRVESEAHTPQLTPNRKLYLLRILLLTVGLRRRAGKGSISPPAAKRVCWAAGPPLDGTRRRLRSRSRTKNSGQAVVHRLWGEYPAFR